MVAAVSRLRSRVEEHAARKRAELINDPKASRISAGALLFWGFWLVAPAYDAVSGETRPTALAVPAVVVFVGGYLALVLLAVRERASARVRGGLLALLAALATASSAGWGGHWQVLFVYVSMCCAITLPEPTVSMVGILGSVGLLTLSSLDSSGLSGLGSFGWSTFLAGFILWVIRRSFVGITTLREVREELATLAVAQERLRFARDLHDLLGHTLSLVVVKGEVVRRLVHADPDAAAREAEDIEKVGREALAEVRQAVAGYRERGLADELAGARSALAAADIEATVRSHGGPLPQETDAVLAWVVREAVTNVIRHSRASHCTIDVTSGADTATVEITDDGVGAADTAAGNGLAGLRERVLAAGGTVATPDCRRGFALQAAVPVGSEA